MTLLDPLLVAALEDAASFTPKGPMLATLRAIDDEILNNAALGLVQQDTAANWGGANPILAAGVIGHDTTNDQIRIGDGVSVWSSLAPIGGAGGAITYAEVPGTPITTARNFTLADAAIRMVSGTLTATRLVIDLSSAGRFNVPDDAPPGFRVLGYVDPGSAAVTLGIVGDPAGSQITTGKSAGATLVVQPGTFFEVYVTANALAAPVCVSTGSFIGEAREIPGDVAADDTGVALPRKLTGFNLPARMLGTKSASFTFAAADAGGAWVVDAAADMTVPPNASVAYPIGTVLSALVTTAGAVKFVPGAGVTINPSTALTADGQYSLIGVWKYGENTWLGIGKLKLNA